MRLEKTASRSKKRSCRKGSGFVNNYQKIRKLQVSSRRLHPPQVHTGHSDSMRSLHAEIMQPLCRQKGSRVRCHFAVSKWSYSARHAIQTVSAAVERVFEFPGLAENAHECILYSKDSGLSQAPNGAPVICTFPGSTIGRGSLLVGSSFDRFPI